MPIEITMPRLSDTMEEGTLVKWRVKAGDEVASGDHLADVETDKATMELQAFDDGKVAALAVQEGDTVPVGSLILMLAEDGESLEDAAGAMSGASAGSSEASSGGSTQAASGGDSGGVAVADPPATAAPPAAASGAPGGNGKRQRVSPVARKIAEEHGIDLSAIVGSGPDGRVIKRDVLAVVEGGVQAAVSAPASNAQPQAAAAPSAPVAPVGLEAKTITLTGMRKTIARRLVESKTTVPHFQVTVSVDMDPLMALRKTLNEQLASQGVKLSVNDFITRATALACVSHPEINSSWAGDTIIQHGTVNVGVAVSLPTERGGGLVVPVIRDAQSKGLRQISEDTKRLAKKARESGLTPEEMGDGTITLSNLGMYGVDQFTAIVNPPQAAILAVGGAIQKPVVRDGQIVVGHEMNVTLSGDHRTIDGAQGAEYLGTFKQLLENPAALLI